MRSKPQSGQVLIFLALAIVVLAGMIGLVIDGGNAQSQKQISQSVADGAALAAGYTIQQDPIGADFTSANLAGAQVKARSSAPASAVLTLTYWTAVMGGVCAGSAAPTATATKCVRATFSFNTPTYFVRVLRYNNFAASSSAEVAVTSGLGSYCAVCIMAPSLRSIHFTKDDNMTVTGAPIFINSSDPHAAMLDGTGSTITASAINIVGCYQASGAFGTYPLPNCGVKPNVDPDGNARYPVVGNSLTYNSALPSPVTLNPGIYNGINIPAGKAVIMNPGVYVLTGKITLGGDLTANGVMLFLACSAYPTPCTSPGQPGAFIDEQGGILVISPPPAGQPYAGLSIFADRYNTSTNILGSGTPETVAGTWYTVRMPFSTIHDTTTVTVSNFIVDSFDMLQNSNFTINYNVATAYYPPGGFLGAPNLRLSR